MAFALAIRLHHEAGARDLLSRSEDQKAIPDTQRHVRIGIRVPLPAALEGDDRGSGTSPQADRAKGEFDALAATGSVLPKSPLGKATYYAHHQWAALQVYTTDGQLGIDNNPAENALRPMALGRKNWLFFGSQEGGRTAAILASFMITCRNLKVEPWACRAIRVRSILWLNTCAWCACGGRGGGRWGGRRADAGRGSGGGS
jgi:hypothetical protein